MGTKTYEYGRIALLAESLEKHNIDPALVEQIMEGGETIGKGAAPEKKSDWLRGAMQRMNHVLDLETRQAVRESCACCLGGKRLQLSKAIAKNHQTLEERIQAANETKMVFGHSVSMDESGKIHVAFVPEGQESYRCVCLPQAKEPLPITYCFCCGGHVKHHLQIALGRPLNGQVRTSALSSGGKKPCTFAFTLAEE